MFELYCVSVAGGTPAIVNRPMVTGGSVVADFKISPDGERVINGELISVGRIFDHKVTPDGSRVISTAEQDTDGVLELYSVPAPGGTTIKLNTILPTGGDVSLSTITDEGPDWSISRIRWLMAS